MNSNFSWTNATLEDYLRKIYGLPPLVYILIIFVLLMLIMLWVFSRFKESPHHAPSDTTEENKRLSAIDETPELLINPETTLERKKIMGTIQGQLSMDETLPLMTPRSGTSRPGTSRPSTSRTPMPSTPQIEQPIPLVQMRQKLDSSFTVTFSPRRKLRLSDKTENVDEGQVSDSSQPTSPGQVEISISPPETPTRRQSLRLKEKKSKDKGE